MNYLIQNATAIYSPDFPDATDLRIRGGRIAELGRDLPPCRMSRKPGWMPGAVSYGRAW